MKDHRRTGHPSHSSLPHTASVFLMTLPQFLNPTTEIPSVLTDGFFWGMTASRYEMNIKLPS